MLGPELRPSKGSKLAYCPAISLAFSLLCMCKERFVSGVCMRMRREEERRDSDRDRERMGAAHAEVRGHFWALVSPFLV